MIRRLTILLCLLPCLAHAISITNIASGSWTNPAIWNPAQIPTFADTANQTGYTVTIDSLINVGTLNHTAGTLTFNAGANGSTVSNDWNFLAGAENGTSTNTIHNITGVHRALASRTSPIILDCPNNLVVSNNYNTAVCYILNGGYSNYCTTLKLYAAYAGLMNINGGIISNINSSFFINYAGGTTNFPLNSLPGSVYAATGNSSLQIGTLYNTTYDLSAFFRNTHCDGQVFNAFIIQGYSYTLPLPTAVITNVNNYCGMPILFSGGGGSGGYCPNVTIDSCTLASSNWMGLSINDAANVTNSTQVTKITNTTLGFTNGAGTLNVLYSALNASVGSTLIITNSTFRLGEGQGATFTIGALLGQTYITNSTITVVPAQYGGGYINTVGTFHQKGLTLVITNQSNNAGYLTSSLSSTSDVPFDTVWFQSNGSTPVLGLSGAFQCGTLILSNPTTTFNGFGYTLSANVISNFMPMVGSNSTILVDQAFVNKGTFSNMTSTVQFGNSAAAATCNLTNLYNVICYVTGKNVAFSNAPVAVTGTLSASGNPAFDFQGGTLSLSNPGSFFGIVSNVTVKGAVLNADRTVNAGGKLNDISRRGQ